MAGLNYGYEYRLKKGSRTSKVLGVTFNEYTSKWIVRVRNNLNQISTLGQFKEKSDAIQCFEKFKQLK